MPKLDPSVNVEWNCFEANYGKGTVDGVGGTVKYVIYSYVLPNKVIIKSLKKSVKYANPILPKITVQYLQNEEMEHHLECRGGIIYTGGI